jgi:hypothetical protein
MALISAVSKKKKAEAKAAQERALAEAEGALTAAPTPAAGPKPSWKEKIEAKKAAEAAGGGSSSSGSDWSTQNARQRRGLDSTSTTSAPPNLNSVMDFPMLPGQTLPQVQSSATTASGSAVSNARITSSNIWSALGASNDEDDDDEDDEDDNDDNEDEDESNKNEMENGTRRNEIVSSSVSVSTVGKNITSSSTKVTGGSSSSSSTSSTTSDALQLGLVQGEGASITTEDATRKLAQNIMRVSVQRKKQSILLIGTITSTLTPFFPLWLSVFMLVQD